MYSTRTICSRYTHKQQYHNSYEQPALTLCIQSSARLILSKRTRVRKLAISKYSVYVLRPIVPSGVTRNGPSHSIFVVRLSSHCRISLLDGTYLSRNHDDGDHKNNCTTLAAMSGLKRCKINRPH